ncbi:NYN domain-containing protein [Azohydromonas aeria]|uniref:NYN domain-containing protein n=1 Tax=Azohydromonas aeria TaxID=2590212 RepID=UPI0012F91F4B|nr:NYN domain-containing protein [Azohydromonas aeria]
MLPSNSKLSRIGIFYDGNFFRRVSNFYSAQHPRHARISIEGLHNYIRSRVAAEEGTDVKFTQIVDAHYFRGRVKAREAEERDMLYQERSFEDVLMHEGITTHYLLMGRDGEKGIDVWLALEAFEMAIYKRFDVLALIAADGDFLPLVRKLNTLGTRVMLLGWDFSFTDNAGNLRETRTSQLLYNEVTYPLRMGEIIDAPGSEDDATVNSLFYRPELRSAEPRGEARSEARPDFRAETRMEGRIEARPEGRSEGRPDFRPDYRSALPAAVLTAPPTGNWAPTPPPDSETLEHGRIANLKETYGFITPDTGGDNVFFPFSSLPPGDAQRLRPGMRVSYEFVLGDRGPMAPKVWIDPNQE